MSPTLTKPASAAQPPPTPPYNPAQQPYTLHPVQTKQTPISQTARHALPALLAALFALRFRALVADPVPAMAATLPLTAALQVAYAVLCLPVAGAEGDRAKAARKVKAGLRSGEGAGKKRGGAGAGGEGGVVVERNAVVVGLLCFFLGSTLLLVIPSWLPLLFFANPNPNHRPRSSPSSSPSSSRPSST